MRGVIVYFENPVGKLEHQADEHADGHPARHFSGGVPAHAVGEDHRVVDLFGAGRHFGLGKAGAHRFERPRHARDIELILVVRSQQPDVRQAAHVDADLR